MSSACSVFALCLNQMSHTEMFPMRHMMTKRTSNQTRFQYIIVPYGHVLVPSHGILWIFKLLIFRNLLLFIHISIHFRLFLSFYLFLLCFPKNNFLLSKIPLAVEYLHTCLASFIMQNAAETCGCLFLSG